MAIFLTGQSRVLIQGITGSEGRKHGARMLAAGTKVVGGTNPRKAGQTVDLNGTDVPVFGTVADTMAATGADADLSDDVRAAGHRLLHRGGHRR
jgi:succinyl-CoA synthetase alpha subunit